MKYAGNITNRTAESSGLARQNRRGEAKTARESAIAARVSQMPKTSVSTYLKATRGRASPRVAIKAFCMECVGWSRGEVTNCTATACPLWMYRPFQSEVRA